MPSSLKLGVAETLFLEIVLCPVLNLTKERTVGFRQALLKEPILLLAPSIVLLCVRLCGLRLRKLSLCAYAVEVCFPLLKYGSILPSLLMYSLIGDLSEVCILHIKGRNSVLEKLSHRHFSVAQLLDLRSHRQGLLRLRLWYRLGLC